MAKGCSISTKPPRERERSWYNSMSMLQGPVLILGGSGMLGRAWVELLARAGVPHDAPPRALVDLSREESLRSVEQGAWRAVVNCAAFTDVDAAEREEARAMQVNAFGPARLAEACGRAGVPLLHYSSDFVFDGSAKHMGVGHIRRPVNAYGRSKARAEELIETSGCRWLIVRTSWIYAPWGDNFVRTLARRLVERPLVPVVNDLRSRPASAELLARHSMRLLEAGTEGIWHLTDAGDPCTPYDIACEIASSIAGAAGVQPDTWASFAARGPVPRAARPRTSVLDLSRAEARLGPLPDWRTALADVLRRLE